MGRTYESIVFRGATIATVALLLGGMTSTASAAKVYRCGNVFQDRPCAPEKETETRSAAKTPSPRDASASAPTAKSTFQATAAPTTDRLVLDAPRGVTIEARR